MESARKVFKDRLDGLVNIEFKPDSSLGPGDLIMESDAGRLDATIKNRRDRVMGVLRESLANGVEADLPPEIIPSPLVVGLNDPLSEQALDEYLSTPVALGVELPSGDGEKVEVPLPASPGPAPDQGADSFIVSDRQAETASAQVEPHQADSIAPQASPPPPRAPSTEPLS
jgi:hypothetical protein